MINITLISLILQNKMLLVHSACGESLGKTPKCAKTQFVYGVQDK